MFVLYQMLKDYESNEFLSCPDHDYFITIQTNS